MRCIIGCGQSAVAPFQRINDLPICDSKRNPVVPANPNLEYGGRSISTGTHEYFSRNLCNRNHLSGSYGARNAGHYSFGPAFGR